VCWDETQQAIWDCRPECKTERVVSNIRQQTDKPKLAKLLIVAIAPPFMPGVSAQTKALSVTTDPEDRLRRFLVRDAFGLSWQELIDCGLSVLHGVKCGIVPDKYGSQNPPYTVVDVCAPRHFADEFHLLRPSVVVTLGKMPYRGLVRTLEKFRGDDARSELLLTQPPKDSLPGRDGYVVRGWDDYTFTLFYSRFALKFPAEASSVLQRAAKLSGLTS
jgi:hypothetical protein